MTKTKLLVIGGGILLLVVVSSIGLFSWHARSSKASDVSASSSQTLGASSTTDSTLPTQITPTQSNTNNSNIDLQDNNNVSSQPSQSQANSNNTQVNPASLLDPKTFSQYDKYKSGTSALFIDLKVGDGAQLTSGKKANVYYKGWLTNGQLFDASKANSKGQLQAFSFTLGQHQVISGWEEGLAGMKSGGVRLLIIPPAVGYGQTGQAPIPPNAILIFQVQLVSVE